MPAPKVTMTTVVVPMTPAELEDQLIREQAIAAFVDGWQRAVAEAGLFRD